MVVAELINGSGYFLWLYSIVSGCIFVEWEIETQAHNIIIQNKKPDRIKHFMWTGYDKVKLKQTSTGLYRSCTALASFSGTFYLILFQAVNFEFIVEMVWFGLVWIDGLNKQKITGFWFALIEFGLVWFAYSTDTQTNK